MRRFVVSCLVMVLAVAARAGLAPVRQHPIAPAGNDAHFVRFDPAGPAIAVVNTSDAPADVRIAVSYGPGAVAVRDVVFEPRQSLPLAALLSPSAEASVVIGGGPEVKVESLEGGVFGRRHRRMVEGDALIIERVLHEPVPFFVANAADHPLHIDVESGGRRTGVDVIAGQLAEFSDLFAAFSSEATTAVIRSATPGAQWFAGLTASPSSVARTMASTGRRRAVRPPPPISNCGDAAQVYQSAIAEMQQFVKTPLDIPAPPKVDYNCSNQDRINDYARSVTDPEIARLTVLLDLMRKMELLGCSPVPPLTDVAPLLTRMAKKEALLPELGDVPEKHVPILTAMIEIERKLQLLGSGASNPALVSDTAARWLQSDQQYYRDRLINQHDYKAAGTILNLVQALTLLTGLQPDVNELIESLKKAMTFRVKITVEVIGKLAGMTIQHKSSGEAVVEGVGILNLAGGPINFIEEKGSAVYPGAPTCTFNPGPPSESGVFLTLDPCVDPEVTVTIQGLVGAAPGGVWSCPGGLPGANGNLDGMIRAALGVNPIAVPPTDLAFDDKLIQAPAFHNLSATAVDDVVAGTGVWLGMTCQGQVNITMTHEPKS